MLIISWHQLQSSPFIHDC